MLLGKALGRQNQRGRHRLAGEQRRGTQRRQAGKQSHKSSLLLLSSEMGTHRATQRRQQGIEDQGEQGGGRRAEDQGREIV